jgi:hypothetical protein
VFLAVACGGGGGGGSSGGGGTTVDSSGNYKNGSCGTTVVSDYNTVVIRCKYMNTDADARSCKSTAQSFLNKYPDINCTAEKTDSSSVDNRSTTLTATNIQKVIDELTALGY